MKPQQLQIFIAAARHGSLRAAARELGITQPAVTHAVRELEGELDAQLLVRSIRGIELTACGLALLPRAEQLVGDLQRAVDAVKQTKGELVGAINIATTPSIAMTVLPRALSLFRRSMPLVKVNLLELPVPEALRGLRNGSLDIAAIHHVQGLDDDLVGTALFSTPFSVALRRDHPLGHARHLHQLIDAEWMVTSGPNDVPHCVIHALFNMNGLPAPARLLRVPSSFSVTLGLLSKTDVIGCVTQPLLDAIAPLGIEALPVLDALPTINVSALMRKDVLPTRAASHFLEVLRDAARAETRVAHAPAAVAAESV
ncbi:LysR substrate-binding domain-containing protein [Paraburkholderia unamae]|uniref:LysR family transcriptional regulator n=1 Tax=Paraburkholderia unamae TaxID=219649 RepID=A0ABX5K958_9BURK|nr:LysR substrate-binding domain-containing protein [Paraburkholderia unamae]PVX61048.1 LysR family transcriptional regulator [Paraburkholderia unamae]RAR56372.1 LysR family transcriptional regulator [Paraburkholderia unamae]